MENGALFIHPGLRQAVSSGRPLLMIQTFEEDRIHRLLMNLAQSLSRPYWIWNMRTGLQKDGAYIEDSIDLGVTLSLLQDETVSPIVWFQDIHYHYEPSVIRGLRDLYYSWREAGGLAVFTAAKRAVPEDLEREMAFLPLPMSSQAELCTAVRQWFEERNHDPIMAPEKIAATLRGLTMSEVYHTLTRLVNELPEAKDVPRLLQEEKRQLISKTGTLEYIPKVPEVDELGGLENLKEWLLKRKELLTGVDESMAEIVPKGLLLMGVSGCGKSLCVKAISSAWELPLYRMEMVRIFSGAYGSPELAFAEACRMMEEMAPAVLWLDEIEMSLSADGSTASDSVMSRIFAFFLTWMQEKPPGLFVAATANRIDLLPAEMIRKGRFDQVFFVDLPLAKEREQIFKIHLEKRGYDPASYTPEIFADATEGWSGAELEQCVISAVTNAKMEHRDLTLKDLYSARKSIVPISTTMEEQVRHIRNWAYERAVRASAEA